MKVGGIDLGLSGAIAVIETIPAALPDVRVFDIPTFKTIINKKERDVFDIGGIVTSVVGNLKGCDCVFIEKVQPLSMPGKTSCSANFSLGYAKGLFEMSLTMLGIKYEFVNPKDWQGYFKIVRPKDKDLAKEWKTKGPAYAIASKLFPGVELVTVKGRVLDGRSDALLIAEWGSRRLKGAH